LALSTISVLVTAVIVALFTHYVLNFPLKISFLLAAIVSSTDAAAVFAVLRAKSISFKGNLKSLLEFESGSNDPMAVFLTIGMITIITNKEASIATLIPLFFQQMAVGALIGYAVGKITVILINKLQLEYDGLYSVLTISTVIFSYSLATIIGGNGFLAVYVAGLTMSGLNFIHKKSLTKFHDGIAWLMQIVVFLMLGLLVFVHEVSKVAIPGLIISFVLMFIARPVAVFLTLAFSGLNLKEKTMISWVGLRGAAPIVLATFPLLSNISSAHEIFDIVFFVVLTSVIIQGPSIAPLAKLLKLDTPISLKPNHPIEFEATEGIESELIEIEIPSKSHAIKNRY
jgi:cell volume regulation protein A